MSSTNPYQIFGIVLKVSVSICKEMKIFRDKTTEIALKTYMYLSSLYFENEFSPYNIEKSIAKLDLLAHLDFLNDLYYICKPFPKKLIA